jgi:hypothetical protein
MLREELIFVGTCDIAGHVRGKGFPARELERIRFNPARIQLRRSSWHIRWA